MVIAHHGLVATAGPRTPQYGTATWTVLRSLCTQTASTVASFQECTEKVSTWYHFVTAIQCPLHLFATTSDSLSHFFLNTVFQFGDEVLKGNCSVGQLTTIGFYQHLMNGYSLRKAYVDSGFLSKNLSRSEVYIRSDGMCQNVFVLFVSLSLLSPLPFQMFHAHSRHVPIIYFMPTHHGIICISVLLCTVGRVTNAEYVPS